MDAHLLYQFHAFFHLEHMELHELRQGEQGTCLYQLSTSEVLEVMVILSLPYDALDRHKAHLFQNLWLHQRSDELDCPIVNFTIETIEEHF